MSKGLAFLVAFLAVSFSPGCLAQNIEIVSVPTSQCLETFESNAVENGFVDMNSCTTQSNQLWALSCAGLSFPADGPPVMTYAICNANSSLCLTVFGAEDTQNAWVNQYTWVQQTNQMWTMQGVQAGSTAVTLVNVESGMCLSVLEDEDNNGVPVVIDDCDGDEYQQWNLVQPAAATG